jgi:glycosyltransferase involved in cell wall biosynthesis
MANKYVQLIRSPKTLFRKIAHRYLSNHQKQKWLSFPEVSKITQQLDHIVATSKNRTVFLFPAPSCPWGYMFQRPQQLSRAISKYGYNVIYMVDTSFHEHPDWHVRGVHEIESGIFLYNDGREGQILTDHMQGSNIIVWQYWPHQTKIISNMPQSIKIYDCIDHLNTFIPYQSITEDFNTSLQNADYVLASANNIFQDIVKIRSDCMLVPNGVNTDDFLSAQDHLTGALSLLLANSKVIVGYYGAIAEWFDFDLVDELAIENPEWTFLIVGEVYPGVTKRVNILKRRKNIVIRPRMPYSVIPRLLAMFDVAMIPFIINEITLNTSPVKIFEYMAGGKQAISTDLPEIKGLPGVYTAHNFQEFQSSLHNAVALKDRAEVIQSLKMAAAEHNWANRIREVLNQVEQRPRI